MKAVQPVALVINWLSEKCAYINKINKSVVVLLDAQTALVLYLPAKLL
jgi:hypothetical protein